MLFHNVGGKRLEPVPAMEGTALAAPMTSRELALGDLFNDGKMDAVINNIDSVPALLKDIDSDHNHWLGYGSWEEQPKRRHRRNGVADGKWDDSAGVCFLRPQLRLDIRHAPPLRAGVRNERGSTGGPFAKWLGRGI